MARSVSLTYIGQMLATITGDATTAPSASSTQSQVVLDGCNLSQVLTTSGTPAISPNIVELSRTMAATDEDVDLTAAPWAEDTSDTVDMTGKKLVAYALWADADNAGNIIITPHAMTNAYQLFITTDEGRTLEPGRHLMSCLESGEASGAAVVDATHKVITITGASGYILKGFLIFA